ncbi:hypothetical protein NM688_g3668 [Phlebia brevispora]|uniref:Uncharacterized protein n=1 Tax=Phlebia brevispora TaxID=194682 RepID=A0ACC1T532_9APHY|nr:hypothetical protein NM688_g3668 [Phlebia brevispora]
MSSDMIFIRGPTLNGWALLYCDSAAYVFVSSSPTTTISSTILYTHSIYLAMVGRTPTQPQSFLSIVGRCDNFRIHPVLQEQTGFRTEEVVTFRLDTKPSSAAIGLLRSVIVEKLLAENALVPEGQAAFAIFNSNGKTAVSFADWVNTPAKKTRVMVDLCKKWRDQGLFEGVIGPKKWRNEMYPVYRNPFGKHDSPREEELESLGDANTRNFAFMMERSSCALFGVVTYGVHLTIYAEDKEGCKIWVPTRSRTKPTWPGYLDNSVAGGIAAGTGVFETLVKECMEEASIQEELIKKYAKSVGSVTYFFSTDAGWLQPETDVYERYLYEVRIPQGVDFQPKPLDGEVESFELLPLSEVTHRMRTGLFKPNCAVVLLDFMIRHGYITPDNEPDFLEITTRIHGRYDYEHW